MRGRFAPTPSGDLHLGGARTALVAWLQARSQGGTLVMRIEDLDGPRTVAGAEARILEDLAWLGIDWDEGPVRQSERLALYQVALDTLLAAGRAFPCWCSRKDVERASQAPHGDEGPRYPGTCRTPPSPLPSRAPSYRLRVEPGTITWADGLHGPCADSAYDAAGDFVLKRADGVFAYQLAVVIDDAAMRITDVVRGDDLLSSTARQLLLYTALGLSAPRFLHVPLVLGPDRVRLAKRHGAIGVRSLRERGVAPERVVGLLAAGLGLCASGAEVCARDLVFDPGRLPREPTVIDPARLTE